MLSLDKQVCSPIYAKRLRELGVHQKTYFHFFEVDKDEIKIFSEIECGHYEEYIGTTNLICAAFTLAELLNLLPHSVTLKEGEPFNHFRLIITNFYACVDNDINKLTRNFIINYECDSVGADSNWIRPLLTKNIYDENPANIAAKMLIFLLENDIIKVEDINK